MSHLKLIDGGAAEGRPGNSEATRRRGEGPRALPLVAASAARGAFEAQASTLHEEVVSPPQQPATQAPSPSATAVPSLPGAIPIELTQALRNGEAVLWWGRKSAVDPRPIIALASGGLALLALVSVLVPELWARPWESLWQPFVIVLAPAALAAVRERANMRALVITDVALIDVDSSGRTDRLSLRNVTKVRRDLWTGGIRLNNEHHTVRIPASMVEDAHAVVRSILRNTVRAQAVQIDDPLHWLD